jgi:hypothetical protein
MLKFIIIGMICNSSECYWVKADTTIYNSYEECKALSLIWKQNTIMYFKLDCMVDSK